MVLANPMEDRSDGDKGEKGRSELFITSGNPTMALEGTEEVFDAVPMSIEPLVKGTLFDPSAQRSQAGKDVSFVECNPQWVGIITLVPDQGRTSGRVDLFDQLWSGNGVGDVAGTEDESYWFGVAVDNRVDLRSEPTPARTHRLQCLTTRRIGPASMDAYVGGINAEQPAVRAPVQALEDDLPRAVITPLREVSVDGAPRYLARQVSPRAASSQHVKQRDHHLLKVRWRPAARPLPFMEFTRL